MRRRVPVSRQRQYSMCRLGRYFSLDVNVVDLRPSNPVCARGFRRKPVSQDDECRSDDACRQESHVFPDARLEGRDGAYE